MLLLLGCYRRQLHVAGEYGCRKVGVAQGWGGNAAPEGTDQVQPRGASSNLPSGSKERPTREGGSQPAQRAAAKGAALPERGKRRGKKRGREGRPGSPMSGRREASGPSNACRQLPTGVGASRHRHQPGRWQGGPAVPTAVLVLLGARQAAASLPRGPPIPWHT